MKKLKVIPYPETFDGLELPIAGEPLKVKNGVYIVCSETDCRVYRTSNAGYAARLEGVCMDNVEIGQPVRVKALTITFHRDVEQAISPDNRGYESLLVVETVES